MYDSAANCISGIGFEGAMVFPLHRTSSSEKEKLYGGRISSREEITYDLGDVRAPYKNKVTQWATMSECVLTWAF